MKLNKKTWVILLIILLMLLALMGYLLLSKQDSVNNSTNVSSPITKTSGLTDAEIRDMFSCDRMTDDLRESDIYCRFPELYRNNTVSDETLRQSLGCLTTSPSPLCKADKFADYKQNLIQQHQSINQ